MTIPCEECLVYASCRFRELVRCDKLYIWVLDIDTKELIDIINSYFCCVPIKIKLSNDFVKTEELQMKISKKQYEICNEVTAIKRRDQQYDTMY
jgi:hypothetical protein